MSIDIFKDLAAQEYDLIDEALSIERAITDSSTIYIFYYNTLYSVQALVENEFFLDWVHRGTSFNTYDLRKKLGILPEDIAKDSLDFKTFLKYVQYVLNLCHLILQNTSDEDIYNSLNPLFHNIRILLNSFNYDYINEDEHNTKVCIYEKNPSATIVASIVKDKDIKNEIIKYNNFTIEGNVLEKRKILTQLYKEYEMIESKLISYNKNLSKNLGFIFNAVGIRHDKSDNKITNELVSKMDEEDLEKWCDKVYETFLLAMLSVNYLDNKKDFEHLKTGENKSKANNIQ